MTSGEIFRIQLLHHTAPVDKQVPGQQLGQQLARRRDHVVLKRVPKRLCQWGVPRFVRNRVGVCEVQVGPLDRNLSCYLESMSVSYTTDTT